jgi:spermidine/putrescine-binding protein
MLKNNGNKLIILFALMSLVICGTIATAQETVKVKVIAYENYVEPYTADFIKLMKDKHGVNVEFAITHAAGNEDFYKFAKMKAVDLLSPSQNVMKNAKFKLIADKLIKPIDLSKVPNYKNLLSILKNNEFLDEGGKTYGVPYSMGPYTLGYNADKVSEAPTSWKVLWEDKYKGQYALSGDFADCNIFVTALANGASYDDLYNLKDLIKKVDMKKLRDEVSKLAQNAHSFWEGTADVDVMKDLSFVATWGYGVQQANLAGQNWKIATLDEGVTAWFDNWVISSTVKDGSMKDTILHEWINYCLTPDVQVGVLRIWGVTPVTTDVKAHLNADEIAAFNVANDSFWNSVSFWGILDAYSENGFQALWKVAK